MDTGDEMLQPASSHRSHRIHCSHCSHPTTIRLTAGATDVTEVIRDRHFDAKLAKTLCQEPSKKQG